MDDRVGSILGQCWVHPALHLALGHCLVNVWSTCGAGADVVVLLCACTAWLVHVWAGLPGEQAVQAVHMIEIPGTTSSTSM
jgi:hypothetical protein